MKKKISRAQIEKEANSGYKPLAVEAGLTLLPLSELSDREFELLIYLLYEAEIEENQHSNIEKISLMQGVAERGRDCVLYNQNRVTGLVQCKKYQARLTRPQVIKEIIKFVLFSTIDNSILPDPDNFKYRLYVSNDFTEPAILLIHDFFEEIKNEISSGKIKEYILALVEEYESFSTYKGNEPIAEVIKVLEKINISSCNGTKLVSRIQKQQHLLSMFFNIKTVIDLESADSLIREALDDYGIKLLTDDDLKLLQKRIGETTEENRINLGFVDFFGYHKEFFKSLKGEPFKEVITTLVKAQSFLDKYLLEFVNAKISENVLINITEKLLNTGKVKPFSVQIAAPYLLKRLSMILVKNSMPDSMLSDMYPQFTLTKDELISEIAERLFETSKMVMNGDYSQLVGNPDDIIFKKQIYQHLHRGMKNIDDAKSVFKNDIKVIKPVLDEIEGTIALLISEDKTVVLKDSSFFNDKGQLEKLINTVQEIDK